MSTKKGRPAQLRPAVVRQLRKCGVQRTRDLERLGISREYLRKLVATGVLQRVARGLYVLADADISENRTLAEASQRVPNGIVCLLSALRFHGLTTQAPFEVWMAIDRDAWRPVSDYPALRIVRLSKKALEAGIEKHRIEGVSVKVYAPAKTVADCFKFRNKVGLDVALEALRDFRRLKKGSMDELWDYAKVCRVANVMRPYMESLT
ncbi:MAG: AbiEi antitoxin N-terminal domain-containing protein [Phycisphaerales bacterium]|nr:AbiEi antitoxin N-terminal domain-containing protein [Phycisphaerales bacterium]